MKVCVQSFEIKDKRIDYQSGFGNNCQRFIFVTHTQHLEHSFDFYCVLRIYAIPLLTPYKYNQIIIKTNSGDIYPLIRL